MLSPRPRTKIRVRGFHPITTMLRCCSSPFVVVAFVLLAVSFKPLVFPFLLDLNRAPLDTHIGTLAILTPDELQHAYAGKRVLVVGGTRGVGLGTALAVASAGASVTIVGRSATSGKHALERLRAVAPEKSATGSSIFEFVEGDVGSVKNAKALVDRLEEHVVSQREPKGFDFLVVTAAVFPDWQHESQQQEDGIDLCFAIAVVGRYIVYKNMARFMKSDDPVRVLNVLASGERSVVPLDRVLASGKRDPLSLFESAMAFSTGNEVMLKLIESHPSLDNLNATLVSTHPGFLKTDLHVGQGLLFDIAEDVVMSLAGISIEDCGLQQASILASPKLWHGQLSYVSSDMRGRQASAALEAVVEKDLPWLTHFLQTLVDESPGLL